MFSSSLIYRTELQSLLSICQVKLLYYGGKFEMVSDDHAATVPATHSQVLDVHFESKRRLDTEVEATRRFFVSSTASDL